MHATFDINDKYLGSGVVLCRSVKKYGADTHVRTILQFAESRLELNQLEKLLITPEILLDPLCMNITTGGIGGNYLRVGNIGFCLKRPDPNKLSIGVRRHYTTNGSHWTGKTHKPETIKKQKQTFKEISHQQGEKNSQYGTCWITHDEFKSKKIKKSELEIWITQGWFQGRRIK